MELFSRCPLRKAVVAAALHSDASIAPGLFGDPVDHGTNIVSVVFIWNRRFRAASLATCEGAHTDVAVSCGLSCIVAVVWLVKGIDRHDK